MEEAYIQTKENIALIVVGALDPRKIGHYTVFQYELSNTGNSPRFVRSRKFKRNKDNYQEFQKFIRQETGTEAIPYDPESDVIIGVFASSLEQALANHFILGN